MFEEIKQGPVPFTVAEVLTWPKDQNWELVDGIAYRPVTESIKFNNEILKNFLKNPGIVSNTITPVSFPSGILIPDEFEIDEWYNLVRPDICLFKQVKSVKENVYLGDPILLLEITSPETHVKDNVQKLGLYEKWMCPLYMIYDGGTGNVLIHRLIEKKYTLPNALMIAQSMAAEQLAGIMAEELRLTA